jgi:hypothetical protein
MMIVPSPYISTVVGIANRRGSFTTLSSNCTYGRSRIIQAGTDEDDNDNNDDDDDDDFDEDDDYFDDDDEVKLMITLVRVMLCIEQYAASS